MLVGFLVEGWDHEIVRAYLAKLLEVPEEELEPDWIDSPGRGWQFVLDMVPRALRRFYGKCAQFCVVGTDNDGKRDVRGQSPAEDPLRPRHWIHAAEGPLPNCRWCQLQGAVAATRPALHWLPQKPGGLWPILVMVPVECIEAWLLATQAIRQPGQGSHQAEAELRFEFKQRFYGKPQAARRDVQATALPLIRSMGLEDVAQLRQSCHSFNQFAAQVVLHRDAILGPRECW